MHPEMILSRSVFSSLLVILVAALLCVPVCASPADTPLTPGETGIRQAHLSWIALTRDAEMNAVITYISTLYETNTSRLNTLYTDFRKQEGLIPATTTRQGFDNLTREMKSISAAFRMEIPVQMERGYGNTATLTQKVRVATTNNPYIDQKLADYWNLRKTNQLADFDAWVVDSQEKLDALKKLGYDTGPAQRTHDVFVSKRPELVSALDAKDEGRIATVNQVILPLSKQLGQQVSEVQGSVSDAEKYQFYIDEGNRAVNVADAIYFDLMPVLLDIGPAEQSLKKLKVDLTKTDRLLKTGNLPVTKTQLSLVKTDLKDLSGNFRDIANSADLPSDLTARIRALVLCLDAMADRMEVT
jgi:hypothetical protein